ncbi:hypothetical protein SAMN04489859_103446 [Paracoccus alcaliphilus]|uniref:Uncharacterized protein n=1 Tax=Paracoccus alcaliphilus TaxID=34002 RepID=A0A1H8LYC0_9RHOB|nr:hypothetical protein [Paracoccus alcaliphilus]WCR20576.1 hypothetical protein JHW40_22035 [Paracoccus alcaliphilus]SEO09888.1 hypothetical protein SAMN04489859_103446 [Paracoccus alcaliphilus]
MKTGTKLMAAGAIWALTAGLASADCAADLAALENQADGETEGIAKDGSLAPLEDGGAVNDGSEAAASDEEAGEGVARDGTPAEFQEGGNDEQTGADLAMSGDDAQAQQEGAPTAVEQAGDASGDRDAAIERARAALAAGDEEACREALDEAAAL